jgi:hypothetical protein
VVQDGGGHKLDQEQRNGAASPRFLIFRATLEVVAMRQAVSDGGDLEDLGATLERLRHLERATSQALERLLRQGKVAEAAVLRREHVATVKALFDAESKAIRIAETRGKLITVDRALAMISEKAPGEAWSERRLRAAFDL